MVGAGQHTLGCPSGPGMSTARVRSRGVTARLTACRLVLVAERRSAARPDRRPRRAQRHRAAYRLHPLRRRPGPDHQSAERARAAPREHGGATGRTGPCVAIPASRSRHGVTRSACLMCDDARHGRGSAHRRNPRLHRCGIQRLVARDVARTKRDRRLEEQAPKIAPRLRQMATPGRLGYLS